MHNAQESDQRDDFELEITDLPPDELRSTSGKLLDLGKRFWSVRRTISTFSLLSLVFVVLVLVLTTLLPFRKSASPLPPPSLTPTPTMEIAGILRQHASTKILISGNATIVIEGVATGWTSRADGTVTGQARPTPQDCPPGPTIGKAHQIGRFPVWIIGFDGPRATIHLQQTKATSLTGWKGWEVRLQVEMKWNYLFPVMLTFGNISNGLTPLFADPSSGMLQPTMSFNPRDATQSSGQDPHRQLIHLWNVNVYFPGAGCYVLAADWHNGHWDIPFSAWA